MERVIVRYCKPVSRILFHPAFAEYSYHLSAMNIAVHLYLPTLDRVRPWRIIERAALNRSYTWHFSTQGLPFYPVTRAERGLLPHIFTLILPKARRLFSVALSVRCYTTRLLAGALLFAVRTFLPCLHKADSAACSAAKLVYRQNFIYYFNKQQNFD